jgi:hypothetical protein
MNGITLQSIFQRHFEDYQKVHKIPMHLLNVVKKIMNCRTAANGYHLRKCRNGHLIDVWYNSCKHRACPQCSSIDVANWLALQKAKLVQCAHYHVIFTLPDTLNPLWLYNTHKFADLFFTAAKDSLLQLLSDPKFLGAKPGILAALQTWGSDTSLHPHIHMLVSAGGVDGAGEWVSLRNPNFLLPGRVLAAMFRGKLLAGLREALEKGVFKVPPDSYKQQVLNLIHRLGRQEWNVHICERYAYGEGVVTYLARYVKGGCISNSRLLSDDENGVLLSYTDYRDEKKQKKNEKTLLLQPGEFIRRILLHIPELRLRTFRSYGIYYRRNQEELNRVREHFDQRPFQPPQRILFEEYMISLGKPKEFRCPVCGGSVAVIEKHYGKRVFTTIVSAARAA